MKTPPDEDKTKCMALRETAKRGGYVHADDQAFIAKMWKNYPEWYAATEHLVFNATVPFGSNVKMKAP